MNKPKCDELDYIHFLIAAQKVFTCTEAARCQPQTQNAPAHDAFTRLLQRQPLDTEALWQEAKAFVDIKKGLLVLDDTTLDKPYSKKMDLVTYHWSGKHQRVVKGINLQTLLWTDGNALIPCDFRVYDFPFSGKTKNEHFLDMLKKAKKCGFEPEYVMMDSWYSSLENLKLIARQGWFLLTRIKSNRLVNPDGNIVLFNHAMNFMSIISLELYYVPIKLLSHFQKCFKILHLTLSFGICCILLHVSINNFSFVISIEIISKSILTRNFLL